MIRAQINLNGLVDDNIVKELMSNDYNPKDLNFLVTARPISVNASIDGCFPRAEHILNADMAIKDIQIVEREPEMLSFAQYANDIALGVVETDNKNCTLAVDRNAKWEDIFKANDEEDDEPILESPEENDYFY